MSRAGYKRLGDYIRQVDVRNRDLSVDVLLGVSVNKYFIPSIANTIGTDMSSYKIVCSGQFVYIPDTSRRGDKIAIALLDKWNKALVSAIYTVFEIVDEGKLLPEYLMMWFRRPEFDRYARFKSHGSAREVFEWEEMCDVMLPVPPIEKQRQIVAEYQAIERRIENNRRLIATLEDTARTIYRKMFVDDIDPENLPEGWRMGTLTDIAIYFNGAACQKFASAFSATLPVLKIRELSQGFADSNSDRVSKHIPASYIINNDDLIFSWSATLLIDYWQGGTVALNQHLFKIIPLGNFPSWLVYFGTKEHIVNWTRMISAKATSMSHIKREDLENARIVIPSHKDLSIIDIQIAPQMLLMNSIKREVNNNLMLLQVLLSKLSKL